MQLFIQTKYSLFFVKIPKYNKILISILMFLLTNLTSLYASFNGALLPRTIYSTIRIVRKDRLIVIYRLDGT
jgi:hypothetical protein